MFSLLELFKQAEDDHHSKLLKRKGIRSFMCHGFRIDKEIESEKIKIIDMTKGGDFYREVSQHEYNIFQPLGWK